MSQEILYTSAPQGLRPGSRGFCTVVSTPGMAKNLAERLEALTGYRAAFALHDPRSAHNPVNYSHLFLNVGGRTYHLLLRICDAGLDYTKRSNKLAHQVAVEPHECTPGGPAWVMAAEGFFETKWDGQVRILPAGRTLRADDCPAVACRHWAKLTGDAGWAGVLAESVLEDDPQPMSVIFKPGTDTLPLVVEAMSLLPPERRWEVTFSTYFTKLPPGVDCLWRFILDDTPEARLLRRNPHARLIDLCQPMGPAQGSSLVEAARTGKRPQPRRQEVAIPVQTTSAGKPREVLTPMELAARRRAAEQDAASEWIVPVEAPPIPRQPYAHSYLDRSFAARPRSKWPMVAVVAGLAILVIGGMVAAFIAGTSYRPPVELAKSVDQSRAKAVKKQQKAALTRAEELKKAKPAETPAEKKEAPSKPPETTTKDVQQPDNLPTEKPKEQPPKKSETPALDPLQDIRQRLKGVLALPAPNYNFTGAKAEEELAKVFVDQPTRCKLTLSGSEVVLGEGRSFEMKEPKDTGGARIWTVRSRAKNAVSEGQDIGTFTLKDQFLRFRWLSSASSCKPACLRFCVLTVEVDGKRERCSLYCPQQRDPVAMKLEAKPPIWQFPVNPQEVPTKERLRLDLQFQGSPPNKITQSTGLKMPGKSSIQILDEKDPNKSLLEIEVRFSETKDAYGLEFDVNAWPKRRLADGKEQEIRGQIDRKWLHDHKRECDRERTRIEKEQRAIQRAITDLKGNLKALERQASEIPAFPPSPGEEASRAERERYAHIVGELKRKRQENKDNRDMFEEALQSKEQRQKDNEGQQTFVDNNAKWCNKMLKLFDDLEKNCRIGYRIYAEIDGQTIDLVRSFEPENK